jgi:hypothetical protein
MVTPYSSPAVGRLPAGGDIIPCQFMGEESGEQIRFRDVDGTPRFRQEKRTATLLRI